MSIHLPLLSLTGKSLTVVHLFQQNIHNTKKWLVIADYSKMS